MIGRALAGGLMVMTMGCTAVPPSDEGEPPVRGGGSCNAGRVQDLVGRQATSELGTLARDRSGARQLRWLRPGDVVTMEFREDRLNVHLDGRGRVTRLVCG